MPMGRIAVRPNSAGTLGSVCSIPSMDIRFSVRCHGVCGILPSARSELQAGNPLGAFATKAI
jgi:hypothetical protein